MSNRASGSRMLSIDVSTKLLENYRSVTPAVGTGPLAVISSPDGPIIAGISSTNRGYVLVEDRTSESGWSSVSLGQLVLNGALAAVTDSVGTPHVFASDGTSLLHASRNGPEPTDWTELLPVAGIAGCSSVLALTNGDTTHVAAVTGGSVSYGMASALNPGKFQWFRDIIALNYPEGGNADFNKLNLFPDCGNGALIATTYLSPSPGWPDIGNVTIPIYEGSGANWSLSTVDNETLVNFGLNAIVNGEEVAIFSAWIDQLTVWSKVAANGTWSELGIDGTADGYALTAFKPWIDSASGRICGIAIGFDPANVSPDSAGYGTPYLFEAQSNPVQSGEWTVTSLAGGEAGVVLPYPQDLVEVPDTNFAVIADPVTRLMRAFALDSNSNLCVMEQQPSGWTPLMPTGHQASALYPVNHPDGFTQVVAVGPDGIYVLSFSADTTEWTRTDVELDLPNEAATYNCYSTEITVNDVNRVFQPGAAALIKCSDATEARINGVTVALDSEKPLSIKANAAGRITVETPIHSLNCPEILVWVDTMEPESWVSIVPQLEVQAKLRDATSSVDEFLAQKDRNGNYVVTGPLRSQKVQAESVAMSIMRCCDIAGNAGTQLSATAGPLARNRKPDRVRYVPPGATRSGRHLNFAAIEPVSWSLDFSSGAPVFRILSDAEAAAMIAPMGLFGIDWGGVWDGIKSGASSLVSVVVRVIVDPVKNVVTAIEASVEALIEGVKQAYSAAVSLVEQVFDVVEGIFTKIKTFFKELIDWLAFFFDWDDIITTKHALKYLINQSYELFDGLMANQQRALPALLRTMSKDLQGWYAQIKAPIGSTNLLQSEDQNPPPDYVVEGQSHNIVQSNLIDSMSNGTGSQTSSPPAITARMQEDLDAILKILEQLADEITSQPAYASMKHHFDALIDKLVHHPDEFLTTGIYDLFGIVVGVVGVALDLAAAVLERLIGLMRAVFRQLEAILASEIEIPIVTPLYKFITGDALTYGDVTCLVAAVPVTLICKLATGKAPFDSSSLQQFETNWKASSLLARAGIGPNGTAITPIRPAVIEPDDQVVRNNMALAVMTILAGLGSAIADAEVIDEDEGWKPIATSVVGVAAEVVVLVLSFPWAPFVAPAIEGPPGVTSINGLAGLSCVFNTFATLTDVCCLVRFRLLRLVFFPVAGPLLTTFLGGFQQALYGATIAQQVFAHEWGKDEALSDIGNMLIYLPSATKFLVIEAQSRKSNGIKYAQVGLDILGPVAGAIMVYTANLDYAKQQGGARDLLI